MCSNIAGVPHNPHSYNYADLPVFCLEQKPLRGILPLTVAAEVEVIAAALTAAPAANVSVPVVSVVALAAAVATGTVAAAYVVAITVAESAAVGVAVAASAAEVAPAAATVAVVVTSATAEFAAAAAAAAAATTTDVARTVAPSLAERRAPDLCVQYLEALELGCRPLMMKTLAAAEVVAVVDVADWLALPKLSVIVRIVRKS
jgi:hypothetical protein